VTASFDEHFFTSSDGLQLYYREFGANNAGTPVICLPGLTRNSRDFERIAARIGKSRRVITPDFRGRGKSARDPEWQNYHPATYVADTLALLAALEIDRVIVIGTSLGGLCAMGLAAARPGLVSAVVMNDIGPEINPAGVARIQSYTGRLTPVRNWDEAVQQTREVYGKWLPGLDEADWLSMAQRAYREGAGGVPELDFDPAIGRAIRELPPAGADPWQLFDALIDTPVTLLWGVESDILSSEIIASMQARKPNLKVVPVANRGHTPLLDEPECVTAIDELLRDVP
tara:strand:- start:3064 stop:3921 length:858 start_codon:yes stop_codon:yes gene_type:complete